MGGSHGATARADTSSTAARTLPRHIPRAVTVNTHRGVLYYCSRIPNKTTSCILAKIHPSLGVFITHADYTYFMAITPCIQHPSRILHASARARANATDRATAIARVLVLSGVRLFVRLHAGAP